MSAIGQQWHAFAAWSNSVLEEGALPTSTFTPTEIPLILLDDLPVQARPRIGRRCPRCGGEIIAAHPADDPSCLQCGHEPPRRPPRSYFFEPYTDQAAEGRHAMSDWSERNGPVSVRVGEALSPIVCVNCGCIPEQGIRLKVHRCPDCYREYCAQLRFGVA